MQTGSNQPALHAIQSAELRELMDRMDILMQERFMTEHEIDIQRRKYAMRIVATAEQLSKTVKAIVDVLPSLKLSPYEQNILLSLAKNLDDHAQILQKQAKQNHIDAIDNTMNQIYARQFIGQMDKPDVDYIEGLSPAVSIDQKSTSHNPRSTVGTVTEIYDFMRLLFARAGIPHCPICGREVARQSAQEIVEEIERLPEGTRLLILSPLVRGRKGTHQAVLDEIRKAGFVRARVDGIVHELEEDVQMDRYKIHTIVAVVDRLVIRSYEDPTEANAARSRLTDSVETALKFGEGYLTVHLLPDSPPAVSTSPPEGNGTLGDENRPQERPGHDLHFSEHLACAEHGSVGWVSAIFRAAYPLPLTIRNRRRQPRGA